MAQKSLLVLGACLALSGCELVATVPSPQMDAAVSDDAPNINDASSSCAPDDSGDDCVEAMPGP